MNPVLSGVIPVLAGGLLTLMGALLGPRSTARRAALGRERDEMRSAYAAGLRAITNVAAVNDPDELRSAGQAVFEAQAQIWLLGTRETAETYDSYAQFVRKYLDATAQVAKQFSFVPPALRVGVMFPPSERKVMAQFHRDFINQARSDLHHRERVRIWRRLARRVKRHLRDPSSD